MLDNWMEVLLRDDAENAEVDKIASAISLLPTSQLMHMAKHGCMGMGSHGGEGAEWLERYAGSELFDQAVALEQQMLQVKGQLQQQVSQEREQYSQNEAQHHARDVTHDQLKQLHLQKAMLDIQLLSQKHQEMAAPAAVAAPPVEAAPVEAPKVAARMLPRFVLDAEFIALNDEIGRSMLKDAGVVSSIVGGAGKALGGVVGGTAAAGRGVKELAQRGVARAGSAVRSARQGASGLGQHFGQSYAAGSAGAQKAVGGALGTTTQAGQAAAGARLGEVMPSLGKHNVPSAALAGGAPQSAANLRLPPAPAPAAYTPTQPKPIGGAASAGLALLPAAGAAIPQNQSMPKAAQDMDAVGRYLAKMAAGGAGGAIAALARKNVPALAGAGIGAVGGGALGYHEGGITGAMAGAGGGALLGAGAGKATQVGRLASGFAKRKGMTTGRALAEAAQLTGRRDLHAVGVRGAKAAPYLPLDTVMHPAPH